MNDLVLTPQMSVWEPQAGLTGYGYDPKGYVVIRWAWMPDGKLVDAGVN